MKKSFALLLLAALSMTFTSSVASASDFQQLKKAGLVRVATEGVFSPFNFYKGSELTGFEVELADAIFKKIGIKTEWKTFGFDSLLIGLNQGRYDLVAASHAITAERAKVVDFTDPHYCSGAVILSKVGGPKTKADLAGKVVSAEVGTIYVSMLQKIAGIKEVKTFPKDTDSLQSLLAGKIDAMVIDKFAAIEMMKANSSAGLQSGEAVSVERIAMAVAKGNTSLRDALNHALADAQKDGTYSALSLKYFGQDIRCH